MTSAPLAGLRPLEHARSLDLRGHIGDNAKNVMLSHVSSSCLAPAMKRLPPLPALHTFLITARCCNFTRAAQLLHITQGAVSRQISGLESHLGYRLFHRQARGLSLTAQGRAFFPRIEQIFSLLEDAVDEVGTARQALQLKAPTCITRWLLPRLMQWQKERPDVPVELTTTIAHGVDFRRERFDAAVVYGAHPGDSMNVHHLFDEQLTPVCSRSLIGESQPLAQYSDLERHMLLHPTLDEQDWTQWLKAAGTRLSNVGKGQHFDTMDLAMTVASQGSGVAMGDWALIGEDLSAGRLVTPFELKLRTGAAYYFVYPERATVPAQLNELLDWLKTQAAQRQIAH
jgi:LysR family glycine cleavage system transcriptional activator